MEIIKSSCFVETGFSPAITSDIIEADKTEVERRECVTRRLESEKMVVADGI